MGGGIKYLHHPFNNYHILNFIFIYSDNSQKTQNPAINVLDELNDLVRDDPKQKDDFQKSCHIRDMKDIESILKFEMKMRMKQNRSQTKSDETPELPDVSLPAFLYSLRDEAKKLIFPNVFLMARETRMKNQSYSESRKANVPIIESLNNLLDIGIQMVSHYQRLGYFLTEKTNTTTNEGASKILEISLHKIVESLKRMNSHCKSDFSNHEKHNLTIDVDIESFFEGFVNLLNNHSSIKKAKEYLLLSDLTEMRPTIFDTEQATQFILQRLTKSSKDAIEAYHGLVIVGIKLQILKLLNCLFQDDDLCTTDIIQSYCSLDGTSFLNHLRYYWEKVIKKKILAIEEGWYMPTILILGKTGTGKSSLCNVFSGKMSQSNLLSGGFPVSSSPDSCTEKTSSGDYCFLGNICRPATIVDSPGFDDPKNESDAIIISDLVDELKQMKGVNQILIAVNGMNPRLDRSMQAMINIFQQMFSPKIWENIGIVFTHLVMDKKTKRKREGAALMTDVEHASEYVNEIKKKFPDVGGIQLDYFFIDTEYDDCDEEERQAFMGDVEKLWVSIKKKSRFDTNFVQNIMTKYKQLQRLVAKRDLYLRQQSQRIRELEKTLEKTSENSNHTKKEICQGYTYAKLKDSSSYHKEIKDYVQYIKTVSPDFNHFKGENPLAEGFWKDVKESWSNLSHGFDPYGSHHSTINIYASFPASMQLIIKNETPHFLTLMHCQNFSQKQKHPKFLWGTSAESQLTNLEATNSFAIPPFTSERLLFVKNKYKKGMPKLTYHLSSVLSFDVNNNYPATETTLRLMAMFKIAMKGHGGNTYGVGFPDSNFSPQMAQDIQNADDGMHRYYIKGSTNARNSRSSIAQGNQIIWPPIDQERSNKYQVSFTIGDMPHCEGIVTFKQIL